MLIAGNISMYQGSFKLKPVFGSRIVASDCRKCKFVICLPDLVANGAIEITIGI
jgi:hypothetical protein